MSMASVWRIMPVIVPSQRLLGRGFCAAFHDVRAVREELVAARRLTEGVSIDRRR